MPDPCPAEQPPSAALARYEELVARALTAPDPAAAFDEIARDSALTPRLRALLANADRNGVRLSAILIAKLRFERLVRGSARSLRWFESDPEGFTQSFRRYHHAVPPTGLFPRAEAADFERWLALDAGGDARGEMDRR